MISNITIPTNITTITGLGSFANLATAGLLGPGILFGLFAVILLVMIARTDPSKAGLIASFICSFAALFLIALGWLANGYLVIMVGLDILFALLILIRGAQDPY